MVVKIEQADIINWILRSFLVIAGIILIYQIIRKLMGGSWDLESIMLTLLAVNIGYSFYLGNQVSQLQGEFKGWSRQFEKRFDENRKIKETKE